MPLILVSAPPGFGKSMLVASWIHSRPAGLRTAWLSLGESDNTPNFFWRYFIAALQSIHAGLGKTAQAMLSSPTAPEMPTVLTTLINKLAAFEGEFLLVLDDYQLIQSPSIHEDLKFFLDHLPANTQMALLTREDPPLGLARRRARRQMVEIRGVDLRFDRGEAAAFLNDIQKLSLTQEQITVLEQPCLFNMVANLKPVIAFNQGRLAENSGQTSLVASAFRDAIELARERSNRYLFHLAGTQAALGQLHTARQTCEQGLAVDAVLKTSPYLSLLQAQMGILHYEWADLPAAEQHFTNGLAHIESRAGEFEAALDRLEELGTPPVDHIVLLLEAYMAWLRFRTGDQTGARAWLAAKLASPSLEPNPVNDVALLDVARLMTTLQRPDEAAGLLGQISAEARSGGRINTFVRARVILARVLAGKGRINAALSCLLEVLPLAAPEGYLSTFLDQGETLGKLLHEAKGKVSAAELRLCVEQVLAAFPQGESLAGKREARSGSPELSDREREILLVEEEVSGEVFDRLTMIPYTSSLTTRMDSPWSSSTLFHPRLAGWTHFRKGLSVWKRLSTNAWQFVSINSYSLS